MEARASTHSGERPGRILGTSGGPDIATIERDAVALAHIPAPTGSEAERLAWIDERLAGAPGELSRDGVGNVVWRLGDPPFELALLVHVDTVFDTDVPHAVVERDGWLCGPGIGDNAVAIAVAIGAVEAIASELIRPLAVVFTVGEEALGGLRGAKHACRTLEPRLAIALEGHGLDWICADAVGSVRVALTVLGPGGHSWWNRDRPSASHALVQILGSLLASVPNGVSVNIGRLAGGDGVNVIARSAKAALEARSLDEERLQDFQERLRGLTVGDGLDLAVETLETRPAGRLDRQHRLVRAVQDERARLGLPDRFGDGSTDANAALAQGIPALALGCANGADMHAPTERIERASIGLGAKQLERVLRRLLVDGDRIQRTPDGTTEGREGR
jgi:tripeptide aminopeptidase